MVSVGASRIVNLDRPPRYKALLIDLDGVLRHWPANDGVLELAHGLPEGALRTTAFRRELLNDVVTGRITDEIWREQVKTSLVQTYPQARVSDAVAAWSQPFGDIDHSVLRLVQRVREHLKIVLVTNGTSRLNRDLDALKLLSSLDFVVNSSVIGMAKPQPDFYRVALREAGVSADEALFVDDSASHVEAATRLGIRSLQFTGHESLIAFLQGARVLDEI